MRYDESVTWPRVVVDQLILMSTISPRGPCKAPISSGSSPDTEAECAVDVAAKDAGQSDTNKTGTPSRTRGTVHDLRVAIAAVWVSGRSEKIGYSTGSTEASSKAT
jgi:hypothetical protein